ESIIRDAYLKAKGITDEGNTASYIPELAHVDPDKFGVHITTIDQHNFGIGNCNEKFSIQSIAKVLSLSLAYTIVGDKIWERVGVEPSGTAFNSLVQLEANNGIPRNPFLNAGALVICDILLSNLKHPKQDFLAFVRGITNNLSLKYSSRNRSSEKLWD
ncbi:UNVERIFIED_CONTAM: hypothetical protein GTU68_052737, partial [Idotea baltica]|nr:hypothetical protein [Idotea baltica]